MSELLVSNCCADTQKSFPADAEFCEDLVPEVDTKGVQTKLILKEVVNRNGTSIGLHCLTNCVNCGTIS